MSSTSETTLVTRPVYFILDSRESFVNLMFENQRCETALCARSILNSEVCFLPLDSAFFFELQGRRWGSILDGCVST